MTSAISSFVGQYAMLNPGYLSPIEYDGDNYPSIYAAVEASKFPRDRRTTFMYGTPHMNIMGSIRPYTDKQVEVLRELLVKRFQPGTQFRALLDSTKGKDLLDGNDAHRNWYGACTCSRCSLAEKHNFVGNILKEIRDC